MPTETTSLPTDTPVAPDTSAGADRARITHIPALDGLRGAAVVAVVLFHGGHLTGGYLGVDLFFVLSGFLITSLLLAEGGTSRRVSLARFWERRARRLLPALAVMLVGVAAYGRFLADPTTLHRLRWDGIATLFYVANWRAVFAHVDYWALFSSPSPMEHTWSLAIEEQFYVVWPLLFVGLLAWTRRSRGAADGRALALRVLLVAGIGAVASGVAALALYGNGNSNRVYYGTDTRAFGILAGVAVAALTARFGHVRTKAGRVALEAVGVGAAALLAVAWVRLPGDSPRLYHGGLLACSAAAALVIAAAAHPQRGLLARVFTVAPLRWLGLISYGLYLYHWPIFVVMDETRTGLTGWPLFGARMAVTLVVSLVSYRVVEQPIRHGRRARPATKVMAPLGGAVVLAALLFASTTGYQAPPSSGFSEAELTAAVNQAAHTRGARIMVTGNSVAYFLGTDGFPTITTDPPITVFSAALAGCTYPDTTAVEIPNRGINTSLTASCRPAWAYSAERFRPNIVVFFRNGVSQSGYLHNGVFLKPCTAGYKEWMRDSLVSDADAFARRGATTYLVTAPYSKGQLFHHKSDYAEYYRSVDCANSAYFAAAKLRPARIHVIDLNAYLCKPDGTCLDKIDGVKLRADGTHFKGEAARIISRWILTQMGIHPLN